jgi:hypothetical protein
MNLQHSHAEKRALAAVRHAPFSAFARCHLSTGRIELTGKDGITRHFQVIREGNEVRLAKDQADRIGAVDIAAINPDEQFAIGVSETADRDIAIGADGEVGQVGSPAAMVRGA